jgi:hypothetical protein
MSSGHFRYGALQEEGAKLQRWIDGHWSRRSTASISNLDALGLETEGWDFTEDFKGLPVEVRADAIAQGLPYEQDANIDDTTYHSFKVQKEMRVDPMEIQTGDEWMGRIGPGVIFLEHLRRIKDSPNPHISQISKALYMVDHYTMDTLKHVYVIEVVNGETGRFVTQQLYTMANGLNWIVPVAHTWEYGTPEYQAILGTRIGKTVAYILLDSFEPGTHLISRIVTLPDPVIVAAGRTALHMRFDIEKTFIPRAL